MEFSKQGYWRGEPFPSPGYLPDPGIKSRSPALQADSYHLSHQRNPETGISSVQSLSRVWLFATPWIATCQASLSITISRSPLKPMSIEPVMPSNQLILYRPLLLLPSIFPSIRVFSNESALRIRWPKYWSLSFNISSSNEHPGLISLMEMDSRMDWLDLLAVQGILKSLLHTTSWRNNSLALSPLYGPALICIHDYWKNHSFDYIF